MGREINILKKIYEEVVIGIHSLSSSWKLRVDDGEALPKGSQATK